MTCFVAGPGKHAFELICDPRIGKVSRDAAVAPGIIVLPVAKLGSGVAAVADALPRPMLARVAESRAAVVFDASGEGAVHTPERTAELHAFARRAGISPGRCAYLTQDRGYGEAYAAHCAALGLSPMAVLAYDHFIRRFFQGCEDDGAAVLEARLRAFEARGAARPRRFISLNLSPRPTKLLLLLGLIHAGLWERGFISFPGFDKARNNFAVSYKNSLADIAALPGFEDLAEEMAAHAPALAALGPMFVGELRRSKTRERATSSRPSPTRPCPSTTFLVHHRAGDRDGGAPAGDGEAVQVAGELPPLDHPRQRRLAGARARVRLPHLRRLCRRGL